MHKESWIDQNMHYGLGCFCFIIADSFLRSLFIESGFFKWHGFLLRSKHRKSVRFLRMEPCKMDKSHKRKKCMEETKRRKYSLNKKAAAAALIILALVIGLVLIEENRSFWKTSSPVVTETTAEVPKEFARACDHAGTVQRIDYPAKDYTSGEKVTKPAYVYLPYGYDETEQYDVLYMMHGWQMRAQDFLEQPVQIKELFDHLIDSGMTRPFIAVCLTFDAKNEPQSYERSVEEFAQFHLELRNDAMPYLESQLATYADEPSLKGLKASRNHRAFAGFSMGAITAWHQFLFNLDLLRGYVIMSGNCWILGNNGGKNQPVKTVNALVKTIHKGWYKLTDYFIYACAGTSDPLYPDMDPQIQEMMKRQEFSGDNMIYALKEGGYHDLNAVREYLYNALPRIFPGDSPKISKEE